jgi:lysozyme family protein
MMTGFPDVFAAVVGTEGTALSSDPNDPGNWSSGVVGQGSFVGSKYGISAAAFPGVDIPNLTYPQAQALAKQNYWDPYQCDQFDVRIGYLVFDAAYNGGHPAQWLQSAAGVTQDGIIGAQTIGAIRAMNPLKVALFFMASRFNYWTQCGAWPTDGAGWVHRGCTVLNTVGQNS